MYSRQFCLQICVETMMHLTCTNMPKEELKKALDQVFYSWLVDLLLDCRNGADFNLRSKT